MIGTEVRLDERKKFLDGLAALLGGDTSLLTQCRQVVAWIACNDSVEGPLNRAEAHQMSEAETAAAWSEQLEIMRYVERLQWAIIDKRAETDEEVQGKIQVLDTLTSIPAWERDALRDLRISIEHDQLEINRRLGGEKTQARRPTWFNRIASLNW
jgi:hypothetical protein